MTDQSVCMARAQPALAWILVLAGTLTAPACRTTAAASQPTTHPQALCEPSMPEASLTSGDGVYAVAGENSSLHRLRFVDGQVSANDSCAIRLGNRLNPRVPPMYINGEPVGFC